MPVPEHYIPKLLIAAIALLLFSCSAATKASVEEVDIGMNEAQVVKIMGEPDSKAELSSQLSVWHYGNQSIQFVDGAVEDIVLDQAQQDADIEALRQSSDMEGDS